MRTMGKGMDMNEAGRSTACCTVGCLHVISRIATWYHRMESQTIVPHLPETKLHLANSFGVTPDTIYPISNIEMHKSEYQTS